MSKCIAYVGSAILRGGKGIYSFEVDTETDVLRPLSLSEQINPTYITANAQKTRLYCVIETDKYKCQDGGAVACYKILADGSLKYLNEMRTEGNGPAHLSVAPDNSHLFVANYGEGTAVCYSLNADGSIGGNYRILAQEGFCDDQQRRKDPHAHFAALTPDEKWLCIVDLGIDSVIFHPYDKKKGAVPEGSVKVSASKSGSGPRHMVFSRDGKYAYVVCELISQIDVFEYLGGNGMKLKQTISTLPDDFDGVSNCAAIRASADGKFIYASNRGHDSVAAFAILADGTLSPIHITPTGGKNPRDINLLPEGKFLLCCNQDEGGITVLRVERDGSLTPTGITCETPGPVCLVFA